MSQEAGCRIINPDTPREALQDKGSREAATALLPTSRPQRNADRVRGSYRRKPGRPATHGGRVQLAGMDKRREKARAFLAVREAFADDAGGWDRLTAREVVLLDRAASAAVVCASIERYIFNADSLLASDGNLLPVLQRAYTAHSQNLSRLLQALGLRPDRADKLPDLSEYLVTRQNSAENAQNRRRSDDGGTADLEVSA
jgi:hypothetical protein